jgi:phage terminase large subunit-like protein
MIRGKESPMFNRELKDNFAVIEVHHKDNPANYEDILNALAKKANRYRTRIRELWKKADLAHLDEIQELNKLLYDCNKFRAEFEYKKNML